MTNFGLYQLSTWREGEPMRPGGRFIAVWIDTRRYLYHLPPLETLENFADWVVDTFACNANEVMRDGEDSLSYLDRVGISLREYWLNTNWGWITP